jgi:hypothetical protein
MSFFVALTFVLSFGGVAKAALADHFSVVGNEKSTAVNPATGRMVTYLTNADHINTHTYPHSRCFVENDRYVLVESVRPRPDGSPASGSGIDYRNTERQILAIDRISGDIYFIDHLLVENTAYYGTAHISTSQMFHLDYAPKTNTLVYYNMTGHNLYLVDLDTGQKTHLWHCSAGTIGDPPSISEDGKRVMVYVLHPGPASSALFYGVTKAVYAFDIENNTVVKGPYLVHTFTDRRYNNGADTIIGLAHVIVNPVNIDEFSFSRGFSGRSDGSIHTARLWYGKADGSLVQMAIPSPAGIVHTHEIWGPKGEFMYVVELPGTGGIVKFNPRTGYRETLVSDIDPRCLHLTCDGSERYFTYETQTSGTIKPLDQYENHVEGIFLFDNVTKQITHLVDVMEGLNHPRQVHPQINEDATLVAYTEAEGPTSKVAVIETGIGGN